MLGHPPAPTVSVVVASHGRPVRLLWLLNALEDQSLDPEHYEVVVAHDSSNATERVLTSHPLAAAGRLRHVRLPAGTAPPGANRNAAWRRARGPLVATVDDDCRPEPDWLACLVAAAAQAPGALIQGRTRPDPDESVRLRSPLRRSQDITPPSGWAEACNMLYPRELLERLGGYDERMLTGEDCDFARRAAAVGHEVVAEAGAVVNHAVHTPGPAAALRDALRWRFMPELVRRHPELRSELPLRIFWKRSHAALLLALVGASVGRRRRLAGLCLVAPWIIERRSPFQTPGGALRAAAELPWLAVYDAAEVAALAAGSVRAGTLVL